MSDPKQIAAMLTEAQKELVLALDPVEYRDWKALSRNVRTRNRLAALGLAWFDDTSSVRLHFMRRLSPIGAAVQAILKARLTPLDTPSPMC